MKVLVTGSEGNLGKQLVNVLSENYDVLGIDRTVKKENEYTSKCVDIRHFGDVYRAMDGVDYVIHTAALHGIDLSTKSRNEFFDTNVQGTLNLIEAAVANKVKKFVFISTISVYGSSDENKDGSAWWLTEDRKLFPSDIYAFTKKCGEDFCQYYNTKSEVDFVCLRTARFYQSPNRIKDIIDYSYKGIHIDDVIQAVQLALENESASGTYNIGADTPFNDTDCSLLYNDARKQYLISCPQIYDFASQKGIELPTSIKKVVCIDKAKNELGYMPKHSVYDILQNLRSLSK